MTFNDWLLSDLKVPQGIHGKAEANHPWWRVMCLTGLDYFSTLGYQPGIAFLAAGLLSPIATLVLVFVTLFGALPIYERVAEASPHGQGSIYMLEKIFPRWTGKTFVLILLGFATTDFTITMTLSAADAATHFVENPYTPHLMRHQLGITLLFLTILGAIFLMGFREAIGVAVVIVATYLILNCIVAAFGFWEILRSGQLIPHWTSGLLKEHSNPLAMIGISLILFPRLALGLSGFETGVAVMPLVKGDGLAGRISNTKKLLKTAAVIMSAFLLATSFITTLLIEPAQFQNGGQANGRALAYVAHKYLGNVFGSVYDLSTILILGFAGASAMAGLLHLIPRYLPRFGMAPEWALASRPLVLVFTAVSFAVTLMFRANVDAQSGAYATGVLVLITSAAIAVTMMLWGSKLQWPFLLIALVFIYTTVLNAGERPEGVKISFFFILAMVSISLISRASRSTELRILGVHLDPKAKELLARDEDQVIRLVARKPRAETEEQLDVAD